MKYIILDIECTCWPNNDLRRQPHEIIEIGAVLLNENYNYLREFDQFVKPIDNPILTEYCKDLTTITQKDVDSAPALPIVISQLKEWMGPSKDIVFCSWGYFDKDQLLTECEKNGYDYPFDDNHINIKVRFSEVMHRSKKMSLKKALRILGIQFEGTPHRAVFDALMTSKVFKMIMIKAAYDKEHNK